MNLRKYPVVKIIKRHEGGSKPVSKENRGQHPESEIKKTVESWIHEFKKKRHRIPIHP